MRKKRHRELKNLFARSIVRMSLCFSIIYSCLLQLWVKFRVHRKPLLCSVGFSAMLVILGYFVNNSSLFTGEASHKMFLFERLSQYFDSNDDNAPSDVVYINLAYEKCLAPIYVNGDSVGQIQLTDRNRINSFLKLIKKANNYKFVVLDVFLDSIDNSLFKNDPLPETLASFEDRIVLANRDNETFAYPHLKHLTSKAKYNVSKFSKAFSRYKYMYADEMTLPLKLYSSLNPNSKYQRFGLLDWTNISPYFKDVFSLYFLDGQLIQNSLFLHFDENSITESQKIETEDGTILDFYDYYNVGDFLGDNIENAEELLYDYINDKIVVIGDLSSNSDAHSTYMDSKCGSEILIKAYHSTTLLLVSFPYILFWFIIFTIVSFLIISDKPLIQRFKISNFVSNKFLCFLISLISYGTLLSIAMLCDYFIFNRAYSLTLPIIFFTILKLFIQYKQYDKDGN